MEDLLKATDQSKVTTDYWKRIRDRELGTTASLYKGHMLEGMDDQETVKRNNFLHSYGSSYSQSRGMMSSTEDLFGPKKPFLKPISQIRKSIDTIDSGGGTTNIENADLFGNVLPRNMASYTPHNFRVNTSDDDLNNKLPDINKRRNGNYIQGVFVKNHNNFFMSTDRDDSSPSMVSKAFQKRRIPKPNNKKKNKRARATTPSEFPNIHTPRGGSKTNRKKDHSANAYKRKEFEITNESDFEKTSKNFLSREAKMLSNAISVRNARPIWNLTRKTSENNSKNRSPHLTPIEKQSKKNKKVISKSKEKKHGAKKSFSRINFYQ